VPADFFPATGAPFKVFQINGLFHFQSVLDVEVRQGTQVFIPQSHLTILLASWRFTPTDQSSASSLFLENPS
jgi:hypothetical protein